MSAPFTDTDSAGMVEEFVRSIGKGILTGELYAPNRRTELLRLLTDRAGVVTKLGLGQCGERGENVLTIAADALQRQKWTAWEVADYLSAWRVS